jgi:hypothetical protein
MYILGQVSDTVQIMTMRLRNSVREERPSWRKSRASERRAFGA